MCHAQPLGMSLLSDDETLSSWRKCYNDQTRVW